MIVSERDELTTQGERFLLYRAPVRAAVASFSDDVRAGLGAARKHLPPKYFYDELGSALFEAITYLPEYYLTRAEAEILERFAGEMLEAVGGPVEIVELGSGSSRKTRRIIEAALERQERLAYHPVDISPAALVASAEALVASYDRLHVTAYAGDYFDVLEGAKLRTKERVLALFLGSNIGNYEPHDAERLLKAVGRALSPGDALLLGADLKKDAATLELAYNDPTGVTAAFDKNVLARINRELGGTFDLDAFEHVARYNAARGSVDSFLVAQRAHEVAIRALDMSVRFATFEPVHTESSYKYAPEELADLADAAGLRATRFWTDAAGRFAVTLLVAD